ncbi:zinc ribbon domain-containing protein [Bifidobacterium aesculapii]|uniref:zinc ribbon domain-containing protein n=1 Tax=Bifidobacterium aesculapii TaxID=1329411 RepID=UPI0006E2104C|nr:zinc ribbon domain-containing protein [Bifidobacterium aesculapii]
MMFCRHCGVNMLDDAMFCVKCGTKSAVASDNCGEPSPKAMPYRYTVATPHPVRMSSLGRMSSAQLIKLLTSFDEQFARIDAIEEGIQSAYELMRRNKTEYDIGLACLLLSGLIGAGALLYGIVCEPWNHQAPVSVLITCAVGIIPLLVGLNQLRVFKHNVENVLPALYPAIDTNERTIADIRKTMRPTLLLLPASCRNGKANAYILQMLICGRADDFNTAASLWEEYDHRRRLEQLERDKVQETRRQTIVLVISALAQVSQAFEVKRQTKALQDLRNDLNIQH